MQKKSYFDKFTEKSNAAKKEGHLKAKRSIKKEIAEGMAKTKARKDAEAKAKKADFAARKADSAERKAAAAARKADPDGSKNAAGGAGPKPPRRVDTNYATRGVPVPEAPSIPRNAPAAKTGKTGKTAKTPGDGSVDGPAQMPLNKYIAHGGITSRREAAELVKQGVVKVNGVVVTEPGHKIADTDEVSINGKKVVPSRNLVYILLNKPKDVITTASDPEGRRTVLDLVASATNERIYPVGRLDRNTTGVLLLTNDGELAQKLSHPAFQIRKIYEIRLDRELTKKDFDTILSGVELEDGVITPDALAYADSKDKSIVGIEIHSGKNRIVRRIFEHLDYKVKNLDRVLYAGLSKKNVDRGRWRFLNEKEVRILKYLNASFTPKAKK